MTPSSTHHHLLHLLITILLVAASVHGNVTWSSSVNDVMLTTDKPEEEHGTISVTERSTDAEKGPEEGDISWDDATWILTSAFIIFTMQSGFGLLEAGCVSSRHEVNILVKNAVDVIFGGISYWLFGYGLCFGMDSWSNPFIGWGSFALSSSSVVDMGMVYSNFIFQLSFATTATTIVSGSMAERTKLSAYIVFSFVNTIVYCLPAHWVWGENGFLAAMGCIDVAGSSAVHLIGATAGLVGTLLLRPRTGRFESKEPPVMGNPSNALVGMFMLWWGWLGFNCGSTFGISYGKWKLAAKAAVNTMLSSMGGGITGSMLGAAVTTLNASMAGGVVGLLSGYFWHKRTYMISDLVNSILGALVSITAGCAVVEPWEAFVIGAIGAFLVIMSADMFDKLHIDDPVDAVSVHGTCGIWSMLSVGLFVDHDEVMNLNNGQLGLFKGGGGYSLGIQALACLCVVAWGLLSSFILLMAIKLTIGLRLTEEEEKLGADFVEHGIISKMHVEMVTSSDTDRVSLQFGRRSSFGFCRSDIGGISGRFNPINSDDIPRVVCTGPESNHCGGGSTGQLEVPSTEGFDNIAMVAQLEEEFNITNDLNKPQDTLRRQKRNPELADK